MNGIDIHGFFFMRKIDKIRYAERLIVLDLEATCGKGQEVPDKEREIIEFGVVVVSKMGRRIEKEFQAFVRPTLHPKLTKFCIDLTKITQEQVDKAPQFPEVFVNFIRECHVEGKENWLLSWGDFDLDMLLVESKRHEAEIYELGLKENPLPLWNHVNLKKLAATTFGVERMGLQSMLGFLGIKFSGQHHRAIDDARNIVNILIAVLKSKK